jgi:hypothetical protein
MLGRSMIIPNVRVMVFLESRKTIEWSRFKFPSTDRGFLNFYMYCYCVLNCLFLGPGKSLGT